MQEAAERSVKGMLKLQESFNKAKRYADFRKMLEQQKDIDAVLVATPITLTPLSARLPWSLASMFTSRSLSPGRCTKLVCCAKLQRAQNVITQMGNMGHSSEGAALINEWVQAGVIGPVKEVHVWTNRPLGFWPQGIPRPG